MNLVVADATLGNDSALATALFDLLKNTRELEYMAHQFHWNIVGVKFNTMHEFYEEEYKQLFEDQDEIAEQIRQQGFFVPVIDNFVLEENYSASGFEEQLIAYAGKLTQNIVLIEKANGLANNEIAVQDLCARLKGLRGLSLNLKVKAMLGANKMSLEPSEANVVESAVDLSISKDTEKELEKLGFKVLPNEQTEDDDEASVAIRKNEDDSFDVIEYEKGCIHLRNAPGKRALMNGKYKKGFKFNDIKSLINYLKKSKATAAAKNTFNATVKVDSKSADLIKTALKRPYIIKEEDIIIYTAKFDNGYTMDIKCCGSDDESAWTEAILYDDKLNEVTTSVPSDDYFKEWKLEDKKNGNTYIAKVTANASDVTACSLDKSDEIAKIDKFLSNLAKKYKVADIEKGRDFGTNPTTSFDWHLYKYSRIKPSGMDNTKIDVIYNAGDITISAHKGETGNGNIRQKSKIHSVKTLERYAEEFAKWAFGDNNNAVTAGRIAKFALTKEQIEDLKSLGFKLDKGNYLNPSVSKKENGMTVTVTYTPSLAPYKFRVSKFDSEGKLRYESAKKKLDNLIEEIKDRLHKYGVTASAVTAGFDKGRYKEIDEESKFFKILKNDCDIRAKNFYAINKGLRLAIKVIKGTFEDASIRFFALKNKGGYVRVELKDKVYIVGYTIYESGKIKVWTRELKSNVPVNSFDYDMLNMYAKPFGTKMISGIVPTWMSI